ncbi:MAG: adenosylmethionine--8-amino-7-oxononanoate transaminase [Polyangiaceae bacterium]|nr:adenosylmethionine--8-amino-7-oxononanoate transaminase [Polyangiaceae bacterium]
MKKSREELVELDKRYVWHPYTQMQEYIESGEPLVISHAKGSRLFDQDGRSYIDGNSSWWTALLGHQHPRLIAALKQQADELCHTALAGITHEPAALLAEALVKVAPLGLTRVLFSDNGSTALEAAIKMALKFWQQNGYPGRKRFVALEGAFHGETLGVTALSGVEVFRRPFADVLMECIHVPLEVDGYERAFAVAERLLRDKAQEIAAVVVEPLLQGAGGMRVYAAEYLKRLRAVTAELDILLVADEVFTGYGRTGPMWACEHAGVAPDILCSAKGFSGGLLPMAATLASERVFGGFLGDPSRALHYGHTYCGNPLGARVALEVLAVYRDESILELARPKAQRIKETVQALAEVEGVSAVRSLGMVGAVELQSSSSGYLERAGWRVYEEAKKRGAYLRPLGNIVYMAPALNISEVDLEELLAIFTDSIRAVLK